MPIKPYEFTGTAEVTKTSEEKINSMLQSPDPRVQQLANSQLLVNAIFGNKEMKKAKGLEQVIDTANKMQRNEGESDFDFEMRKQKHVMENAGQYDPNVAVQANQNLINLMKDKKAQSRLEAQDARTQRKFERDEMKFKAERTYGIERYDPNTGQWEPHDIGEYTEDPDEMLAQVKGYTEQVTDMNNQAASQGSEVRYRVNKQSEMFEIEDPLEEEGIEFTKPELRKYRNTYLNAHETATTMMPLLKQINSNLDSLQGAKMRADGTMDTGIANQVFTDLTKFGEEAMTALDALGIDTKQYFSAEKGGYVNVNEVISEGLRQQGLDTDVAQARVVALAYAIAKARDPNGRLSDQDVSLAMRSLTGNGGARQIAALFADTIQQQRNAVLAVDTMTGGSTSIVPAAVKSMVHTSFSEADAILQSINKRADERSQPRVSGQPVDMGDGFSATFNQEG